MFDHKQKDVFISMIIPLMSDAIDGLFVAVII